MAFDDSDIDPNVRERLRFQYTKLKQEQAQGRLWGRQLRTQEIRTGMDLYSLLKPIIIIGLIALFLVGPGITGLVMVFKSVAWYWWVLFLVFAIIWWRRS